MKRKGSKTPRVQYGKTFRYGSPEAAIKDLTKLEKKLREAKEGKEQKKR
jgi:hypothetical protein